MSARPSPVDIDNIHGEESDVTERMLHLIDLEQMFRDTANPIIVNKTSFTAVDSAKNIANKLFSENDNGIVDYVASCECGATTGNYHQGTVCKQCGTEVRVDFVTNKDHRTWISIPDTIKGVLHPVAYNILSDWLTYNVKSGQTDFGDSEIRPRSKVNLIDAIIDPTIPMPVDIAGDVTGRGFNYLHDNFDYLMGFFLDRYRQTSTKWKAVYVREFITKYRDIMFTTKLPVLAAILQPVTKKSDSMRFLDAGSRDLLKAIHEMCFVEFAPGRIPTTELKINRVMLQAYKSYLDYNKFIIESKLGKKPALIRRHALGSRLHWSFRSVIAPISGAHRYDELHMPWSMMVNTFRLHIINRLEQVYGMTTAEAYARHQLALSHYDSDIHDILNVFIRDYPTNGQGIPVLFDRPPTLRRGSQQYLYVTKVKTDLSDNAISMSTLVLVDSNADRSTRSL